MAKKVKLEQGGQTLLPATTSDMVVHPTLKVTSDKLIGELNISTLFPTGGTDGSNKYTLETAIAKIPNDLRRVGIKCSFLNEAGEVETWEWQGGGAFASLGFWVKIHSRYDAYLNFRTPCFPGGLNSSNYYLSILYANINFEEGYVSDHLYGLYYGTSKDILDTTKQLFIYLYDVTDSKALKRLFGLYSQPTDENIVTFYSADKRSIVIIDRSVLFEGGNYAIGPAAALNRSLINNPFNQYVLKNINSLNTAVSVVSENFEDITYKLLYVDYKEKTDNIATLDKAFAYSSSLKFFQNEATNPYFFNLYKLEPGKYYSLDYVNKLSNLSLLAGYVEKESDFVVGGTLSECIIEGGDFGRDVLILNPQEEKLLVVLGRNSDANAFVVLKEGVSTKPVNEAVAELNNTVLEIKNSIKEETNKLCCPDKFYAVVGEEFNLYYDSVIKAMDNGLNSPFGIYIDVQCPDLQNASNKIGVRRERIWQIEKGKLTSDYIGEHTLQITAYNSQGDQIDQKQATIVVTDADPLSSQKYILCIGDSLTNNGPIVKTCAEHFNEIGGTQPIFIGQRTTSGYKHEGYPGYGFGSFVASTAGYTYRIFDVPEDTNVSVEDKYSTNGTTFTVKDIRTEGLDNKLRLRCERSSGTNEPTPTGTLTKVSGKESSAQTIEYSAYEAESGNPFWDDETGADNFTKYREKMDMGDAKFDIVVIMLGTNNCVGGIKASMQDSVDNAITLINAILADAGSYPTKIILQMTPPDANTISSWQVYTDRLNNSGTKIGYWTNLWNLRRLLYEEFTKDEWVNKVFLGQAALGLDRYYEFPYTELNSSERISTVKELYHTNSVHPNVPGYQQLGDGYYLQMKALI